MDRQRPLDAYQMAKIAAKAHGEYGRADIQADFEPVGHRIGDLGADDADETTVNQ